MRLSSLGQLVAEIVAEQNHGITFERRSRLKTTLWMERPDVQLTELFNCSTESQQQQLIRMDGVYLHSSHSPVVPPLPSSFMSSTDSIPPPPLFSPSRPSLAANDIISSCPSLLLVVVRGVVILSCAYYYCRSFS